MPSDAIVHVIDDDDAVRESLEFLLRSARITARTYESAAAFLEGASDLKSGCVITDIRMPGMTGIELLQHLQEKSVPMPVIVITGHGDVPLAVEAMKSGAADFIEKPFDDEILLAAVHSALNRQESARREDTEKERIASKLAALSQRERQVLDGLIAGHANKVIAYDLGISPRTVEIYRANVMTKMEAASLSELVRMALTAGVLDSPQKPGQPKGPG
jgi:two-component system response regulator FixJ